MHLDCSAVISSRYFGTCFLFIALIISSHLPVLYAFCISTVINIQCYRAFCVFCISDLTTQTTSSITLSFEWFVLKPCRLGDSRLFASTKKLSLDAMIESTSFGVVLRRHSGRNADGSLHVLFGLRSNTTLALLCSSGKIPLLRTSLAKSNISWGISFMTI